MFDWYLWADDPLVRVLGFLVHLAWYAFWALVFLVVLRLATREYLIWKVTWRFPPDQAREMRRRARRTRLLGGARSPRDPYLLTTPVMVRPYGDGRPGWGMMAPAPPRHAPHEPGPDGSRQDAAIELAAGTYVLVTCFGRVGAPYPNPDGSPGTLEAAETRAVGVHTRGIEGWSVVGPVDYAPTGLGHGWRLTMSTRGGARMLTDTHVDHEGWAFAVGVLSASHHARAVDALDRMLATWRWRSAHPAAPTEPW
ncbi:hypothetical protein OEB99_14070 [Actinotalea sp. M2MS4P-6]|uniref:hypothetical protein n=1 Tax=Actinotalea sp. M2MS4P-6 TaxID=2983762 RepID=UPI0021E3FCC2|nr:hypothetical protein [Actinotalea sp. M2MS4P-6]MCV2395439.1 hypothetical protein [Actinotalea sp. M2MS4P-6]